MEDLLFTKFKTANDFFFSKRGIKIKVNHTYDAECVKFTAAITVSLKIRPVSKDGGLHLAVVGGQFWFI